MTFPTIVSESEYTATSQSVGPHAVPYPASLVNGNVVFISIASDGSGETFTTSDTFTQFGLINAGSPSCVLAWREVDGTEGATFDLTISSSERVTVKCWQIGSTTDPNVTPPVMAVAGLGGTTNPDPPLLAPPFSGDILWFAITGVDTAGLPSVTIWPLPDNQGQITHNLTSGTLQGFCTENDNVASKDPSTFTLSVAGNAASYTVAFAPSGAAGGPTITAQATTAITTTTATGNVDTDTVEGTMWGGVWLAAATPSIAEIKAGTGAVAGTASSQSVTAGSLTFPVTGLAHNVNYNFHFVQEDAGALDSNQDSDAFTTLVDPVLVLSSPVALNPTATTVTPRVTSNEAGGNLWAYAVVGSGQTPDHATIRSNAQSTSTPVNGVNTMPDITGLTHNTAYTLAFTAEDTASPANESAPVYVDFSTLVLEVNVVLRNISDGSLFANETAIEYAVWDNAALGGIGAPVVQSSVGTTDANGVLTFNYGATLNQNGIVLARQVVAGADNTNDVWAAGGILAE